jgi:hypothetical protein
MARAREGEDFTRVIPLASIQRDPGSAPKDARAGGVLLEAKLLWAGDVIDVAHVRVAPAPPRTWARARARAGARARGVDAARGLDAARDARREVRVRELGLAVPGGDDIVVARVSDDGVASLVTPAGELVPAACLMTIRLGRTALRLALVDDAGAAHGDGSPAGAGLRRTPGDARLRRGLLGAAVLHLALLALAVQGRASDAMVEDDALDSMRGYVASLDARALGDTAAAAAEKEDARDDATFASKKPDEGAAGAPSRPSKPARARAALPELARADRPEATEVATFGMIGIATAGSDRARTSAFAGDEPARGGVAGNIFGSSIDDALGAGGLGLSSAGQGGGGQGAGVPLTTLGVLGTAGGGLDSVPSATNDGQGFGCGCGAGAGGARLVGTHVAGAPRMVDADAVVTGRLPPEIVQRVVRQGFGRMRDCYERALVADPSLEGRVAVKFVIDREGQVTVAEPSDRSLPNADVASCVARSFLALSFPKPKGGIVTVVYPIVFSTG